MKKSINILLLLHLFPMLFSCATKTPHSEALVNEQKISNQAMLATNWYQTSGELAALYLQGYQLAELRLNEQLKIRSKKPYAIIIDIDETILDNSPYQARLIKENASYPKYWSEWINLATAKALPGALDFLRYAHQKNVEIFYITNRKENEKLVTFNHLKRLTFPITSESHLLVQTDKSNKSDRRNIVIEKFNVALYIGDNLNDFDGVFEKKSVAEKFNLINNLKESFGRKFIIMPNPLYGDWEGALYQYNYKISPGEKLDLRLKALNSF